MAMQRIASDTIHWTARNLMSPGSVVKSSPKTVISERRKLAAAWQFAATKVVHAVVLHQATMKPNRRP